MTKEPTSKRIEKRSYAVIQGLVGSGFPLSAPSLFAGGRF